jgi:hypothetical protein
MNNKKEETKIAVKKILITMGKHEVGLTLQEARELQRMLNDMFQGPAETVKHVHHYDYWKTWQPNYWQQIGGIGGAVYGNSTSDTDNHKLQTLYEAKCNALEVKAVGWAGV